MGPQVAFRAGPVRLLEAEEMHSAMAAGGTKQRRLHRGRGECEGVDGRGVSAPPEGVRLIRLRQAMHAQHCAFHRCARQQAPIMVPAHCRLRSQHAMQINPHGAHRMPKSKVLGTQCGMAHKGPLEPDPHTSALELISATSKTPCSSTLTSA